MSDPFNWPALARGEEHLGETLQCRVGIWGKVHRQASDYRWIARSDGFGDATRCECVVGLGRQELQYAILDVIEPNRCLTDLQSIGPRRLCALIANRLIRTINLLWEKRYVKDG